MSRDSPQPASTPPDTGRRETAKSRRDREEDPGRRLLRTAGAGDQSVRLIGAQSPGSTGSARRDLYRARRRIALKQIGGEKAARNMATAEGTPRSHPHAPRVVS